MTERIRLLKSIATTASDYRFEEILAIDSDHVNYWIEQFDEDLQLPILRELDHVLARTYFSKLRVTDFLENLIMNADLVGSSPTKFWNATHFLDIQQNGHSQHEMLEIFDGLLETTFGITTAQCGSKGGDFIYIDDVLFSGNRIGNDLEAWIAGEAPTKGTIHVILIALHTGGYWLASNRLKKAVQQSGKALDIKFWRLFEIENRRAYKRGSEVLWPAVLPDEDICQNYIQLPHRFPFEIRPVGGKVDTFSSEQGRQLLEKELLLAGLRIRDFCANPKDIMRPLGFSPFGLGFGSMIVTFRNCPNNCPLALWWGDPDANPGHPFSQWYPLFPRKTYAQGGFDYEVIL